MQRKADSQHSGFTLVEIMIVVVIIGLLTTLAIPSLKKVKEQSSVSRFANDLRIYRGAMEAYMLETGELPGDGGSGNLHNSMKPYISESSFESDSAIGGQWDIELNKSGVASAVGVHKPEVSVDILTEIDEMLDDGDTTTGNLRMIAADRYYWVLVEN